MSTYVLTKVYLMMYTKMKSIYDSCSKQVCYSVKVLEKQTLHLHVAVSENKT